MMRRLLAFVGLLLIPAVAGATSFRAFYDDAGDALATAKPSSLLADFIIDEMRTWNDVGIELAEEDIERAIDGRLWTKDGSGLCQGKKSPAGQAFDFAQGGSGPGSCTALQSGILELLTTERETDQLAVDLLSLTNGAELSVADEPHRPVDMPTIALTLRRVWSGTGASAIPWDGSADVPFKKLDRDLQALTPEELDAAVLRFRHGYYRDDREDDPRFTDIARTIRDDLGGIAHELGIADDDPTALGVFAVPSLKTENVGLWARKDDVGLLFIAPMRVPKLEYRPAGTYPVLHADAPRLAYPFDYEGPGVPAREGLTTPLCSRTIGRQGYLCRPQPLPADDCDPPSDASKISLVRCSGEHISYIEGPAVCPDFGKIFTDDGTPLTAPGDPGRLSPDLETAVPSTLCSPENKVLYADDIQSHACFVGLCVRQSVDEHTLVPERSPAVAGAMTSPFLSCRRADPMLGLYTEFATDAPYPMPQYLGLGLVQDFERAFCSVVGKAPLPLGGLCVLTDNELGAAPISTPVFQTQLLERQTTTTAERQTLLRSIAPALGQRASLEQVVELQRKTFAVFSNFIDQIASLILELKKAPLTATPCPWIGQFPSSPSGS